MPFDCIMGSISYFLINGMIGVEIGREEPKAVSFSYCDQWQGAPNGQRACIRYANGTELGVVKHMSGIFFDFETYEIVRSKNDE